MELGYFFPNVRWFYGIFLLNILSVSPKLLSFCKECPLNTKVWPLIIYCGSECVRSSSEFGRRILIPFLADVRIPRVSIYWKNLLKLQRTKEFHHRSLSRVRLTLCQESVEWLPPRVNIPIIFIGYYPGFFRIFSQNFDNFTAETKECYMYFILFSWSGEIIHQYNTTK